MEEVQQLIAAVKNLIDKNQVKKLKSNINVEITVYCGYDYKEKKDVYRKDIIVITSVSRSSRGSVFLLDNFEQTILPEEVNKKGCLDIISNL